MSLISLEYTLASQNQIVHDVFNVYSNHKTFKLQKTGIQNTQFTVYISDISVTLTRGQGHQIYNDSVDPKQGYNHEKFERSCLNGVREKVNVKGFRFL